MQFQLRVFNRICKHHIETSYFHDHIMLLKCLNKIIYLSDTYLCLLNLGHDINNARHSFSTLSTDQLKLHNL